MSSLSSIGLTTAHVIWLAACGVCILTLIAQATILIALWRRTSRVWRLGLISVIGTSVIIYATLFGLFNLGLDTIDRCYILQNCGLYPSDQAAAARALTECLLVLLVIAGLTCACVVWAFKLRAREPRSTLGPVWLLVARLVLALIGVLASAVGLVVLGIGAFLYVSTWFYIPSGANVEFSGFGYFLGFIGIAAGAIGVVVGVLSLWLASLRRKTRIA